MKLTNVIASVNNNPNYYMFIPAQIKFWNHFKIKFTAVFVGDSIPSELLEYSQNIILWNHNLDINTVYVAQNLRMYFAALLSLPDDELVMITDMDMLPMSGSYYTDGLENFTIDDFIYYRNIYNNSQIFMCYNAAHPSLWSRIFSINTTEDIKTQIYENYQTEHNGIPGSTGWCIDQEIMYNKLINYANLHVLERPIRRLEVYMYKIHLLMKDTNFISQYDDAHFHRSFSDNKMLILDAENQLKNKKINLFFGV
jgi:hypothetical protein